jgi:hypothetical protein
MIFANTAYQNEKAGRDLPQLYRCSRPSQQDQQEKQGRSPIRQIPWSLSSQYPFTAAIPSCGKVQIEYTRKQRLFA